MTQVRVVIAAHKEYEMPVAQPMYLPVQVGAANTTKRIKGFVPDNSGKNISAKNASYCELTALYWAWRNLDADYLGLAHYRRYLGEGAKGGFESILTEEDVTDLMVGADVILPKPRNYYVQSVLTHYNHAHHPEPLQALRNELQRSSRPQSHALDEILAGTTTHLYNMFIMRRELVDEYCTWLFGTLKDLEKNIDTTGYTAYESRVYGFLSELMLDAWVRSKHLSVVEASVIHLESEQWPKKVAAFVGRIARPHRI